MLALDAALEADEAFADTGKTYWRMQRRTRWKRYISLKKEAEKRWNIKVSYTKNKKTLELYLDRVKENQNSAGAQAGVQDESPKTT